MHPALFPQITDIPFVFIRGVKLAGDRLEDADMMRGEETELLGMGDLEEGLYILPGSHSKLIEVDQAGRIVSFRTEMTGEMIAALAEHTILAGALDLKNTSCMWESLWEGYCYCDAHGLNEALFKVRILKNLFGVTADAAYSFFLGVVLHDEIRSILEVRWGLEQMAIARAIDYGSDAALEALEVHVNALGTMPLPSPSQAAEIAFRFHHEMTLCGGNSILPLIYSSFKVPCTALWIRFCRKFGVAALYANVEQLYKHLLNRDKVAAAEWTAAYLQEAISGSQQIYEA
jgi:hypothetical protein